MFGTCLKKYKQLWRQIQLIPCYNYRAYQDFWNVDATVGHQT